MSCDPSKRYWITEQGIRKAAEEIVQHAREYTDAGGKIGHPSRNGVTVFSSFIRGAAHSEAASPPPMTEAEARKWCDDHRKHPVIGKAIQGAQSWQPDGLATIIAYVFSLAAPPQGTPDSRIKSFWDAQAEWSRAAFGSDEEWDHVGPLKHLAKEAVEAQVRPSDPVEIGDCFSIILDAARRSGMTLDDLMTTVENKLVINKARKWPKPENGEVPERIRPQGTPAPEQDQRPTNEERSAKLLELKQAYDCGNLGWSEAIQLYWTWRDGHSTVAAQTDPFSKGYKNRRGPVSDACGDGRHSECTQTFDKCNCTVRSGHKTMHAYFTPPVAAQKEKP